MQSSDSAAKRLSKLKPLKALGMDGEFGLTLQELMSRGGCYR